MEKFRITHYMQDNRVVVKCGEGADETNHVLLGVTNDEYMVMWPDMVEAMRRGQQRKPAIGHGQARQDVADVIAKIHAAALTGLLDGI